MQFKRARSPGSGTSSKRRGELAPSPVSDACVSHGASSDAVARMAEHEDLDRWTAASQGWRAFAPVRVSSPERLVSSEIKGERANATEPERTPSAAIAGIAGIVIIGTFELICLASPPRITVVDAHPAGRRGYPYPLERLS